jgi:hypothetical protein
LIFYPLKNKPPGCTTTNKKIKVDIIIGYSIKTQGGAIMRVWKAIDKIKNNVIYTTK